MPKQRERVEFYVSRKSHGAKKVSRELARKFFNRLCYTQRINTSFSFIITIHPLILYIQ